MEKEKPTFNKRCNTFYWWIRQDKEDKRIWIENFDVRFLFHLILFRIYHSILLKLKR